MSPPVFIELHPAGDRVEVPLGGSLRDVLFAQGVEFPCGGKARCRGCRVKILEGDLPMTPDDARLLSATELRNGWRLACRATVTSDLRIEIAQWDAPILADDSTFLFIPQEGLGVAVDLGTTTIAAQLLDLRTGRVLAVRTALNPQARHGADVMSRIDFALNGGLHTLGELVRVRVGNLIDDMLHVTHTLADQLQRVVVVGNSAMHHLFCGLDVRPLAQSPFEPTAGGLQRVPGTLLTSSLSDGCAVVFLPCLGGFVGSDILAGIFATRLHERTQPCALIDLGTNGEIVVGNREKVLCASTAAGPAFEGARISMGMRAATGAICGASADSERIRCDVIGSGPVRGICGSGLVDVVSTALDLKLILRSGRFSNGSALELCAPVVLTQKDVRELQLAKGAIAAGLEIVAQQWGTRLDDLEHVYLAGAFGNSINHRSALRIGLLNVPAKRIVAAGNSALLGAKLALFDAAFDAICFGLPKRIQHVHLNEDAQFQDLFVGHLDFPEPLAQVTGTTV